MEQSTLKSRFALGFALLSIGGILVFGGKPTLQSTKPSSSFASEPVVVTGFSASKAEGDKLPQKIIIPSLEINLNIRESRAINGYWEVFEDSAGWGEGSGLPGENNNQVVFAHAREGLFQPLKDIVLGDEIYILTENKWYGYEVKEIKEVFPDQTEVIAPTESETLTLYTCSGFNDAKRLIVAARPIESF